MGKPSADVRFRAMYDTTYHDVFGFCLRRASIEDAKDATADVYLIAWRRFDDLPEANQTLPWLYGTARKVLANQRRSRSRLGRLSTRIHLEGEPEQLSPEATVVRREQDQQVLDALCRLRESDSEIIRLAVWEELSHAQIGSIVDCSERAVTMRLHRALKRLERQLRHTTADHKGHVTKALARETEALHD